MLKWVFERINGESDANRTPIGYLPTVDALDVTGLDVAASDLDTLLSVDRPGWQHAVPQIREHYATFGDRLPPQLAKSLDALERSLG